MTTESPTAVRDILTKRIPGSPYLTLDVSNHDGLCDVSAMCGAIRFQTKIALGTRSAKQVADIVYEELLAWARRAYEVATENPKMLTQKHRRAARGFHLWFQNDPRAKGWINEGVLLDVQDEELEAVA